MNILIFGYFGFENFGDEWLLSVLKKLLFEFGSKDKTIFVLYNVKKVTVKSKNLVYIPRWDIIAAIKTILTSDTVLSCGGVFQDQTSIISFVYYFLILLISKIFGKKVVLLSTEFVIEKLPSSIIKLVLLFVDYVFIRNKIDNYINENKVQFCPDICLIDAKENFIQSCNNIKTIGLILKKDNNSDIKVLQKVCMNLAENYKLVFIPLHLLEDYEVCLEIARNLKSCEIRVWDKLENYVGLFKNIDLVITSRLHGIVISICLGIPFVCISDEKKVVKFLKTMFNVKPVSFSELKKENFDIKENIICYDVNKIQALKQIVFEKFQSLANNGFI